MNKAFLRTLFTITCLLQFIFGAEIVTANEKDTLRIITYNIHHANPPSKPGLIDLEAIAAVINQNKPDLVALQEVDVNNRRSGKNLNEAAALGSLTGMHHHFVKAIDYEGGAYGVAILSKWPIQQKDSLILPMAEGSNGEPRVLAIVTVEPKPGKPLVFASTHLDLKEQNRLLQAEAIVKKLSTYSQPVILGGDFNAKPESDVINHFDTYFSRSKTSGSAAFTIPEVNPDREIDFIMFRPKKRFQSVRHEVIKEPYASDHLPVMVELTY